MSNCEGLPDYIVCPDELGAPKASCELETGQFDDADTVCSRVHGVNSGDTFDGPLPCPLNLSPEASSESLRAGGHGILPYSGGVCLTQNSQDGAGAKLYYSTSKGEDVRQMPSYALSVKVDVPSDCVEPEGVFFMVELVRDGVRELVRVHVFKGGCVEVTTRDVQGDEVIGEHRIYQDEQILYDAHTGERVAQYDFGNSSPFVTAFPSPPKSGCDILPSDFDPTAIPLLIALMIRRVRRRSV